MFILTSSFLYAHERIKEAPPPPSGYQVRTVMAAGKWLIEAYHPYLPSFVLVGDEWLAVDPEKSLFQGAISAHIRLGYFKATGEFLD